MRVYNLKKKFSIILMLERTLYVIYYYYLLNLILYTSNCKYNNSLIIVKFN